jgi:hypothetical protein
MINIPTPLRDPTNMADWIEFRALTAGDRNASAADLRRVIVAVGEVQTGGGNDEDEQLAAACFHELQDRAMSSGSAYPFVVHDGLITLLPEQNPCWAYTFCLLLSLAGADRSEPGKPVTELFEEVADAALGAYVGKSLKFGFPRRVLPTGFKKALQDVMKQLREGEDVSAIPQTKKAKDAAVDLIAWRPFPDQRQAQLIVFGQCAAGANWQKKLSELNPSGFYKSYWRKPPAVDPLRAFCTPFRISADDWYSHASYGGILFDRCRIANLACTQTAPKEILQWNKRTAKELLRQSAPMKRSKAERTRNARKRRTR